MEYPECKHGRSVGCIMIQMIYAGETCSHMHVPSPSFCVIVLRLE
jgi:hypothetical protein